MKIINASKPLVLLPIMGTCVALLAGCHSTHHEGQYYGGSSGGASQAGTGGTIGSSTSSAMQSDQTGAQMSEGQTAIPLYEEQLVVGTRSVDSGTVRLRKQVTTETVNQPVQIRRETLVVDREAAGGSDAAATSQTGKQSGSLATPFQSGDLVIQLHSEEPVVETRVVPTGRIIVQTRTNTEQQTVQRQVRRETIDVDKGNSQNVIISDKVNTQKNEAVGGTPATSDQTQGQGAKDKPTTYPPNNKVTTDEGEPFPRPQPDGRDTFHNLKKNP